MNHHVTNLEDVVTRVSEHEFHPVNEDNFTIDRTLRTDGIADLDDPDWQVRLLAVRDLVRIGDTTQIAAALAHDDPHVRYVCAMALGILGEADAASGLKRVAGEDPRHFVRTKAIASLGQIEAIDALDLLHDLREHDDRDIRHQAELAMAQIDAEAGASDALLDAYLDLDPSTFGRVTPGDVAPPLSLPDTDNNEWRLADHLDGWLVLVWVFADWCPVCHREFDELIDLRDRFAELDVSVATVECHDRFRGRVMVGHELEPEYWFADESFQETYVEKIWWPHLLDRAGGVGAEYGVDPLAFAVHGEYINRPATVVIDPTGTVRLNYVGTFWGDRPSIAETLEMIETETFDFEHPERLTTQE